ncbi:MAG: hypothetical protein ACHQF4_01315 [Sphingobacteriales bacterium]
MRPEDIAKVFDDWKKQESYEWQYEVDDKTYQERPGRLFKQSLPVISNPVTYPSTEEEIFVISDLHIASGRTQAGVYKGSENFFADEVFDRFIDYILQLVKTRTAVLVINGDVFDFLRVTEYPGKVRTTSPERKLRNFLKGDKPIIPEQPAHEAVANEFEVWSNELKAVGLNYEVETLKGCISKREKVYGLETDAYKTIYKLIKIKNGHPLFFSALAKWLLKGNRIMITKGNHDLEICWPEVRNYIRLQLAKSIAVVSETADMNEILKQKVFPRIKFIDDSVVIDHSFYLEHGHRYDKFTMVLGSPVLKTKPSQINMPFGSFFNRYVINRVELYYPYLDKVRPAANILPILVKENFPLAVKVIFQQIPFAIRMLSTNGRYVWFMINRVFWFLLALLIPLIIIIISNWTWIKGITFGQKTSNGSFALESIKGLALMVLSYLLSRLVGWFQLSEPDSLAKYAKIRDDGNEFDLMSMGHTHNPGEYILNNGLRFYNTGTWIPVIEISDASVRNGCSYTFLHLDRNGANKLQPANGKLLQRWNDDAGRADPQLLIEQH